MEIYGLERGRNVICHKSHKYIWKEKIKGKWRYYYKRTKDLLTGVNNPYDNINSRTYDQKKQEIMNTKEWRDITKDPNSEYLRVDANGNKYYDIDQYMVDKKHPVIDALTDYGYNRPINIQQQSAETFVAGLKDYVEMGRRTIENVMTIGVGLLTFKLKNQHGSYDAQKRELKQKINNGIQFVNDLIDTYNTYKSSVPSNTSSTVNDYKSIATQIATDYAKNVSVDDVKNYANNYANNYGIDIDAAANTAVDLWRQYGG